MLFAVQSDRIKCFGFLFFLLYLAVFTLPLSASTIEEKCGDLQLTYTHQSGAYISFQGTEILKKSSIAVVRPDWSEVFFVMYQQPELVEQALIEDFQGGKRIVIPIRSKDPDSSSDELAVEGKETITLLPDHSVQYNIELTLLKDAPALIEWQAAGVSTIPLVGCTYQADTKMGTRSGRIPLQAPERDDPKSRYAEQIHKLTLDSRIGPILIESQSDLRLFDYRKDRWADSKNPVLWLGRTKEPIQKGQTIHYDVTFRFPPAQDSASQVPSILAGEAKTKRISKARIPMLGKSSAIIPKPVQVAYTDKFMPLKKNIRIFVGDNPSKETLHAASFLQEDLQTLYHLKANIICKNAPAKIPTGSILLGGDGLQNRVEEICIQTGLVTPEHEEGYALVVNDSYAAISSQTPKGAFYGVTTLIQLVAYDKRSGFYLKGAEIVDYPSLDFRGIHCFTSHDGAGEINQAIRDLMARYKLNTLVWECEFMHWDNAPEIIHPERGMPKSEAAKVREAARQNFLEIIPLVQSLGHLQWIFTGGHNLDLAEDPDTPYALCPTNPDSYKFIFSIFKEAIDFFQPRIFHIGHDEVTIKGRFPYRSKPTGKTATDLVMEDIEKVHDWFTQQDIQVMLWGDMFITDGEAPSSTYAPNKEEAQKRRDRLPRDCFVADWHYIDTAPEKFISLPLFKDLGHPVVGCSWYRPGNIANQSHAARLFETEGMMHTTWASYNFRINENWENWYQYWTYITAGHYFWSDDKTDPNDLSFYPQNEFLKVWFHEKPLLDNLKGFSIDLKSFANRTLADNENSSGWLGFGPEFDYASLPASQDRFGDVYFDIPAMNRQPAAVMLAGKLNPRGNFPQAVQIDLNKARKADEVHFLMTAAFPAQEYSEAGEIVIAYKDGQKDRVNLVYMKNLFSCTDDRVNRNSRIVWHGKTQNKQTVRLWDLVWNNPYPEKKIASIHLGSAKTEAAPIFLGITGVER